MQFMRGTSWLHIFFKVLLGNLLLCALAVGAPKIDLRGKESAELRLLLLADLHFDPFAAFTRSPCGLLTKLRSLPVTQWQAELAQAPKLATGLLVILIISYW